MLRYNPREAPQGFPQPSPSGLEGTADSEPMGAPLRRMLLGQCGSSGATCKCPQPSACASGSPTLGQTHGLQEDASRTGRQQQADRKLGEAYRQGRPPPLHPFLGL